MASGPRRRLQLLRLCLVLASLPLSGGFSSPTPAAWDASTTTLKLNGQPAVLRGLAISCLEFACDAKARPSSCAQDLASRDVDVVTKLLLAEAPPATAVAPLGTAPRVVPTVRLPLTAEFYLGTSSCTPANGQAYATFVDGVVERFTASGIVVIVDLHWNYRALAQTSMALAGNSVAFWKAIASRHGSNPLVMYELYNEPFLGYFDGLSASEVAKCFDAGGCEARLNDGKGSPSGHAVEGVTAMIAAVRSSAPGGVIVLAGPGGWAWEATLLAEYAHGAALEAVVFNLHPYMGPYQDCDPAFDKSPAGFAALADQLLHAAGRPLILTEFGQYCCGDPANAGSTSGACSDGAGAAGASYDGVWEGQPASYNDAVLAVAAARNASWTAWAWVPGGVKVDGRPGAASCAFPMVNDGVQLIGHDANSRGVGSLSATAKCDASVTITSASHGVNASAMWAKHYARPTP